MVRIEYAADDPTPVDSRWDFRYPVPASILASAPLSALTERLAAYLFEAGFRLNTGAPDVSLQTFEGGVWAFVNVDNGTDPSDTIANISVLNPTTPENDLSGMRSRLVAYAVKAESSSLSPGKNGPKPTTDEALIAVRDLIRLLERTIPALSG